MAVEHYTEHAEQRRARRVTQRAAARDDIGASSVPRDTAAHHRSLLSTPALFERGNQPMRVAVMSSIQRTYGNRAVQRLLRAGRAAAPTALVQRDKDPKVGWSDAATKDAKTNQTGVTAPSGGWNEGETLVGNIRRIPIEGLKVGSTLGDEGEEAAIEPGKKDPADASGKTIIRPQVRELTKESSIGKAIVLIPKSLDLTKNVQVLLHLHGWGVGYRQRTRTKEKGMETGTVRDVEIDRMEQQLEASKADKRNMIAVLPQGRYKSVFGGFDSDDYLSKVFERLVALKVWEKAPPRGSTVLSGHSGAGETFREMIKGEGKNKMPANVAEFISFDAINGKYEYFAQRDWIVDNLNNDLAQLKTKSGKDQLAYLKTSPKYRGYHTGTDASKGYAGWYVSLDQVITEWWKDADHVKWFDENIKKNGKEGAAAQAQLKDNYKVTVEAMGPSEEHEAIIGKAQDKFGGKAALEDALSALP